MTRFAAKRRGLALWVRRTDRLEELKAEGLAAAIHQTIRLITAFGDNHRHENDGHCPIGQQCAADRWSGFRGSAYVHESRRNPLRGRRF